MRTRVLYSQNREDLIISAFFDDLKEGFYVDVGAYHPSLDSVTKYFYKKGWTGINIEPQKYQYSLLVKDRERDININIGVSDKVGHLKLRQYKSSGFSTFSDEMKKSYDEESNPVMKEYEEYSVEVDTLSGIFEKNRTSKITFLKVDVEGFEYEVLNGNNWKKYRPDLICIEANHIVKDWRSLLLKNNYHLVFFDGLNEYYLEEKSLHRKYSFAESFPRLLIEAPIISSEWLKKIKKLEKNAENYENVIERYKIEINNKDAKIRNIERQYKSLRFLLKKIKHEVFTRLSKRH